MGLDRAGKRVDRDNKRYTRAISGEPSKGDSVFP
jgi:hypothetical protein